jgi:hypothetical protein
MKNYLHYKNLPLITAVLGAAGFGLRKLLYAVAEDGKGLIPYAHPLTVGLWILTAAALGLALWGIRNADEPDSGGSSRLAAAGCVAAAIGIGLTVLLHAPVSSGALGLFWRVLGILSFASLVVAAMQRWQGKQPYFLLSAVVCVFFAVHMVSGYQNWSRNPQIMDYVFTLLAGISLMLFAYQQGACAADCGSRRLLLLFGTMAVFFCFVCLSGTDNPLLYLTGGLWAMTNLTLEPAVLPEECDDGAA